MNKNAVNKIINDKIITKKFNSQTYLDYDIDIKILILTMIIVCKEVVREGVIGDMRVDHDAPLLAVGDLAVLGLQLARSIN